MNKDYDNVIRIATSLDIHDEMCIRDRVGIKPEGYRPLKAVQDQLRAEIVKDKKAEKIMADMKAATNMYKTSLGIPFRVMKGGNNIAYTSLWDNYPDMVKVPLSGKASHAYLLLVGSTNHMPVSYTHLVGAESQTTIF